MTTVNDPFAAAPQLMKQWMGVSLTVQDSLEASLIELVKIARLDRDRRAAGLLAGGELVDDRDLAVGDHAVAAGALGQ